MQRHLKSSERGHTFEELVELTRGSPRRSVDMMIGRLEFTQLGEFNLSKTHCLKIIQNVSFFQFWHFPPNNCFTCKLTLLKLLRSQFCITRLFCYFKTPCKSTTFDFLLLDAYKDNFVALTDGDKVRGKVFRPNIECIDGYIHMTDTVMLDDSPPWTAISSDAEIPKPLIFMTLLAGFFTCIFIY